MDFLVKTHPKMNRFTGIPLGNIAVSLRLLTRRAYQNIVRQAFTYAKRHGYGSVTVIRVIYIVEGIMYRNFRDSRVKSG